MTLKTNLDEIKTALVEAGVMMVDRDAALMAAYQLGAKDAKPVHKIPSDPMIVMDKEPDLKAYVPKSAKPAKLGARVIASVEIKDEDVKDFLPETLGVEERGEPAKPAPKAKTTKKK
jgi:L-ascorbate metabolism protein UlaG (beta-lactamase superfamily)